MAGLAHMEEGFNITGDTHAKWEEKLEDLWVNWILLKGFV